MRGRGKDRMEERKGKRKEVKMNHTMWTVLWNSAWHLCHPALWNPQFDFQMEALVLPYRSMSNTHQSINNNNSCFLSTPCSRHYLISLLLTILRYRCYYPCFIEESEPKEIDESVWATRQLVEPTNGGTWIEPLPVWWANPYFVLFPSRPSSGK